MVPRVLDRRYPRALMPELEPLPPTAAPGFALFVGEAQENEAWGYLRQARADLAMSGLPRPNPRAGAPADTSSYAYAVWNAWDQLYAAESSHWLACYGDDLTCAETDATADELFRAHLLAMYAAANRALELNGQVLLSVPEFPPLVP